MKNNHGFSNILIMSIIVIILGIVTYFTYPYFFQKNLTSTSNLEKSVPFFVNYRNTLKLNIPEGYEVKEEEENYSSLSKIYVNGEFKFIIEEQEEYPLGNISPKFTYLKNENSNFVTFTTQIEPEIDNEENLKRATIIRDNLVKGIIFLKSTPFNKDSCVKEKGCQTLEILRKFDYRSNKIQFKDNNYNLYYFNISSDILSSYTKLTKFNDKLLVLKENSLSKPGFLLINLKDNSYEDLDLSMPSNYEVLGMSVRGNQILFVGSNCFNDCKESSDQKDLYIYDYENKSTKLLKKDFIKNKYITFLNSDNSKANFIVEGEVPYSWKIVQLDLITYEITALYDGKFNDNNPDVFYNTFKSLNLKIYSKLIFDFDKGLNFEDEYKFEDYSKWGNEQNFMMRSKFY